MTPSRLEQEPKSAQVRTDNVLLGFRRVRTAFAETHGYTPRHQLITIDVIGAGREWYITLREWKDEGGQEIS